MKENLEYEMNSSIRQKKPHYDNVQYNAFVFHGMCGRFYYGTTRV